MEKKVNILFLTGSEQKQLRKVKKFVGQYEEPYLFWFMYDDDGVAIGFEGGFSISRRGVFRNDYILHNGILRLNEEQDNEKVDI